MATRHDQYVVDSAPKRTTSRAAGFSTTDTSRTVNCRPTPENGSQPKASISAFHPDSNSIEENVTSVRARYLFVSFDYYNILSDFPIHAIRLFCHGIQAVNGRRTPGKRHAYVGGV